MGSGKMLPVCPFGGVLAFRDGVEEFFLHSASAELHHSRRVEGKRPAIPRILDLR